MGSRKSKRLSLARRVKFLRAEPSRKRHPVRMQDLVAATLLDWRSRHPHRRFKVRKLGARRVAATIRFAVADGFYALDDFVESSSAMGLACSVKLPKRKR